MKTILLTIIILFNFSLFAEEGHDHSEGEGAESSANVGPEKGITEKNEKEESIRLSSEAVKRMKLTSMEVKSLPLTIPVQALVKVKSEKYVFRVRDNWYKRIEIQIIQKTSENVVINSSDLSVGDQVVITGLGFLRTAEIFSEEGATHSH